MIIQKATPFDNRQIAPLLLLAMEDIVYRFIGKESKDSAIRFLENLIEQSGNQYSHENCWVMIENEQIIATACVYNGKDLHQLRRPVAAYIQHHFHKEFHPEDETQAGEYYIDCISVSPLHQGKGLGASLLQFLITEYPKKQQQNLGLLVDRDNPSAKRLYLKLGFKIIDERTLTGKPMEHLQFLAVGS